jgi:hypothetical protein
MIFIYKGMVGFSKLDGFNLSHQNKSQGPGLPLFLAVKPNDTDCNGCLKKTRKAEGSQFAI